jgi:hypothetical protein
MAKWADYGISAVRYNTAHTHIDRVRAYPDTGESLGSLVEFERTTVVAKIKAGTTFVTIVLGADGQYRKGQPVYIIKVNGVEYIKTVDNGLPGDNLENLPQF